MVVIDEAAFFDEDTYLDILAPLMVVEHACMVGISTLGNRPTNFFNKLIKDPYFYSYKVTYVCDPCLKKGFNKQYCVHKIDSLPHWSSENNLKVVKRLFGSNEDRFALENLGIEDEGLSPFIFQASKVTDIFTNPRLTIRDPVRYFFVTIDPVAGSDDSDERASDFVILTIGGPDTVIYGCDAIDVVDPKDYNQILVEHIRKLRQLPLCQDSVLVVDVEAGTGLEANHIVATIQSHFKRVVIMRDFHRKEGTKTTAEAKREMVQLTLPLVQSGQIRLVDQLVTSHPNPDKMLKEFQNQGMLFAETKRNGKSTFSGKAGGKRDDMWMTLLRAVRARKHFFHSGKYNLSF
jgi:hypothetical protein